MYDDNSSNNTGNQSQGDNTPPPMLDTPMSADPPANDPLSTTPDSEDDSQSATYPPEETSTPAPQSDNDFANPEPTKALSGNTDELLSIKQQALEHLTPLVGHLDQSPKEEFRTTMMMIQATDNQDLIKKAFEAAQKIGDDKERAQAFLDIINEINYFTQQHQE